MNTSNSHNDCNNADVSVYFVFDFDCQSVFVWTGRGGGQPKADTCRQGGMGGQNVLKMCRHPLQISLNEIIYLESKMQNKVVSDLCMLDIIEITDNVI